MTDLYIKLHHIKCAHNGETVKIIYINMDTGAALLICGCEVTIGLDKFTAVI